MIPVIISLIGSAGIVGAALVAGVYAQRTARQTKDAIGVPNGTGNVVQMLERTLIILGRHEERFDDLDQANVEIGNRLHTLESK